MSRIGKQPIELKIAKAKVTDGSVEISGPKGSLTHQLPDLITVSEKDGVLTVIRRNDSRRAKALHGLTRSILANMAQGVVEGWEKVLEVQGVGFRAEMQGASIVLSVGFSHQVTVDPVEGVTISIRDKNVIVVTGVDKIAVGNLAAKIRHVKPPDAYKGKGVRYLGEVVHLKAGKAGKVGAAGEV
ncbi:50S ribosomal protein L6 [Patescibacteria group bacterium]|nr:50S ribosomal protein L6 [Patescibacteria group bacterium]